MFITAALGLSMNDVLDCGKTSCESKFYYRSCTYYRLILNVDDG